MAEVVNWFLSAYTYPVSNGAVVFGIVVLCGMSYLLGVYIGRNVERWGK